MPKPLLTLLLLALPLFATVQSRFKLVGSVLNAQTDETVAGDSVLLLDTGIGAVTDSAGGFTLSLPTRNQTIQVSSQGFETQQRTVTARADLLLRYAFNELGTNILAVVTMEQMGRARKH